MALIMDNVWRFIDVNLAAMQFKPQVAKKSSSTLQTSCNEFFFLTNPYHFIYTHFPKSSYDWQFLARPVTFSEFKDMVYIKPVFVQVGLEVRSHGKGIIECPDGRVDLELGCPADHSLLFYHKLTVLDTEGQSEGEDRKEYNDQVFIEQVEKTLSCSFYLPLAGKWKFELFVRDTDSNSKVKESKHLKYYLACVYVINNEKACDYAAPMPKNSRQEWGPGYDLTVAGLVPLTHNNGMIDTHDGMVQLWFQITKKIDFLAKISAKNEAIEDTGNLCLHWLTKNHVIVQCRLPKAGDYSLELYAKDRNASGNLPHVCSYLINSHKDTVDPSTFPAPRGGRLGGTSANKIAAISPKSHKCPYIELESTGSLEMTFNAPQLLVIMAELWLHNSTTSQPKQIEDHVLPFQKDQEIKLTINFPDSGYYRLALYAKPHGTEGEVRNIYNYVIKVTSPAVDCVPFPKSYAEWAQGCRLIEPTSGLLTQGQNVAFKVDIPIADTVAVKAPGKWTMLEKVSITLPLLMHEAGR